MKCMAFCVKRLPKRLWKYAIVTVALLSIVLAIAGLWRAGTDGRLAALVERAASHGVASMSVIDAAAGAKDIALY